MNKKLRSAVWVTSDGTSDASGVPLDPERWQMDHVIPKVAGGTDDVANLRATTADENQAKSSACPPSLRAWQRQFVQKWTDSTDSNFLLVALPGAGKTIAALSVARDWVKENPVRRRVLIVVPTDSLRTQWKDEAAQLFGLQFHTKEFYTFKNEYQGGIVTYAGLCHGELVFKRLCCVWDTLVICDEIHHASDHNEWGGILRRTIEPAARRLLMSGTPFRGDRTRIPFVNYGGDGRCVADDSYDYPRAIRDNVIRIVRFQHDKGIVRRISPVGVEEAAELHSGLDDNEADELLRKLVEPGNYTEILLRAAHDQLLVCQRTMPTAAGLVLASNQLLAEKLALQLGRITGTQPALIVSDDDKATSTVKAFRDSNRSWVVAVRQISEGVDIKRLMVLTYLTTTKTELYFRQAVGRIVRNLRTEYDMESYCFIPDHPVLVKHAQNIINAQAQAIEEDEDKEPKGPRGGGSSPQLLWPVILGTEHTGMAGSIIEGDRLPPDDAAFVQQCAQEQGVTQKQAWGILQAVKQRFSSATVGASMDGVMNGIRTHVRPLEDQQDEMRTRLEKACKAAAYRLSPDEPDFRGVNTAINRYIGKRRHDFNLDDGRRAILFAKNLQSL